jgi:outer membrane lipoprotein-sorting protein
MSVLTSRPGLRWLVPAGAALAVLGGGVAIGAITAATDPSLPTRSAAQLLTDLQTARLDGLSGTVVARADLGLPPLPMGGTGSSELSSLVSGTHTLRVWYSGPDQARVALLGTLGETDVITNGTDVWVWSSRDNKATHRTVPARDDEKRPVPTPAESFTMTPDALAKAALAMLDPSTEVTTDGSASVAGRDAYELILKPRDPASLIGSIRLAIDAAEHVPLRVAVDARGSADPAIEVAFTQVSFDRPDASQFAFNPPPGAEVVEETTPESGPDQAPPDKAAPDQAAPHEDGQRPPFAVVGTGWTSVLVTRLPTPDASQGNEQGGADIQGFLEGLPKVSGPWGSGRVVTSRLFSVLIVDDGRVLVGAVSADRLYAAAADPAAKLGP